jgi:hypothetical protein
MVKAMGLKIIALLSPSMASTPYQMSSKSTGWFKSYWDWTQAERQTGDLISFLLFLESRLIYIKNNQVTIKNKFAALENLKDNLDVNRAWDTIRENIKFQPKRVSVIVNQSVINSGLMRNVQN